MIIVIDYDAGNTANVLRALRHVGADCQLSSDPELIQKADGLILPGVGAFPAAMAELNKRGLVSIIKETAAQGRPILGICLGMQLLLDKGLEYQETAGLGVISGTCRPIKAAKGFPVPHMGWNTLEIQQKTPLTKELNQQAVYFVHSFYADVAAENLDAWAQYSQVIPAMIHAGHVYGVQFHPEKSGEIGLKIIKHFVTLCERHEKR